MGVFEAVRLTDSVYWVGAIDWAVRDFHGYSTGRGSTYNAYLVMADRITLIDTVKRPFLDEMMQRISSVVEPSGIDLLISNHSEMDHTGALPETLREVSPSKVYASAMGARALAAHFHWEPDTVETVGSGDSVDLGNMGIRFLETRMLHWPDSMVSYIPERKVLFSQDGFGMHLASTERFDDQLPESLLKMEAAKYYANILMPYSQLVEGLLEKMAGMDLDIELICPDHGPVWRSGIRWILEAWGSWARQSPAARAAVVYDTMWGSTGKMARAVVEGLSSQGISTRLLPLRETHISDIATEVLEASALVVGSPTLNGRIFPSVAECMSYLGGLRPANMTGAAFGSYGWSGEAVAQLNGLLRDMKVSLAGEGLKALYVPDDRALESSAELGRSVGRALNSMIEGD